jgi:hypothetical protein
VHGIIGQNFETRHPSVNKEVKENNNNNNKKRNPILAFLAHMA